MHFYKVAPFEFLFVLETEVHASYAHLRANGNQATQIRIEDLIIIFESITNTAAEIEEACHKRPRDGSITVGAEAGRR